MRNTISFNFKENIIYKKAERGRIRPDKIIVEEMSVDKKTQANIYVDNINVEEISVEKIVEELSVDKISVDKMSVDKLSVMRYL